MKIATLQDLLGTVPESEFRRRVDDRVLTLWRAPDRSRLTSLLAFDTLDHVLEHGALPASALRMTRQGAPLPATFFTREGRPDPVRIRQLLAGGASLVFSPLDGHVPAVDQLVANIRAGTKDHVRTGAIVTTGIGGAFDVHFDNEDLLIVQLEGTKRWRLHRTPVLNAVRGMTPPAPPAADDSGFLDETLEPGDLLLLPAGVWHHCENGPGRSVHLGIFFVPPSLPRAADNLRQRLLADPSMRAPLLRGQSSVPAAEEAAIKARLIEVINDMSITDLIRGDT